MTKALEMEHLRAFIESLPRDSYLHSWLLENLAMIERDIADDFCISPTITESKKEAGRIIAEAHVKAGDILATAEKKAAAIRDKAESYQSRIAQFLSSAAHRLYEV